MEHLEVSFTLAYILVIEPALPGDIFGDTSDVFTGSDFVLFAFFFNIRLVCSIEPARPEPMTAAQLVEHLTLPSCQFDV